MSGPPKVHPIEASDELMSRPKAKRSRGDFDDVLEEPWKSAFTGAVVSFICVCV